MKFKKSKIVLILVGLILCCSVINVFASDVKLTILTHPVLYTSGMGGDNGLIPKFMEETGYKVEIVTGVLEDILEKSVIDFATGTGAYDIITYNDRSLHKGVADYFLPLDSYIQDAGEKYDFEDIIASTVDFNRFNGKVYGIPFRYGCTMFHYRQDIFEKYNVDVPKNYEDLMAACKKITEGLRAEGINDVYAIVLGGEPGHGIFEDFDAWLAGHGARIVDDNGICQLDSEAAIKALEDYVKPYHNGWSSPDTPGMTRDKLTSAMQRGKAAMALMYSGYWGLITDPNSTDFYDQFAWDFIPTSPGVERGRSQYGGWNFNINKYSKNPEQAWQLVEYLSNPSAAKYVALEHANSPVRKSVFDDPIYLERYPIATDWLKAMEACEVAIPGGSENISQIMDIIGYAVSDALMGKKTPREAMLNANEEVSKLLDNK